jgi:recombinational DNA repair protein RecT
VNGQQTNGQSNNGAGANGGGQQQARRTPEQDFAAKVSATAKKQLIGILGTEAGQMAAHKITMAMLSAMRTSRDPSAFLKVTEASIADCVSTSYETQLYPGGPNPVVYLVPQAPRRGEQPELQWRITHRGLAVLAARAGFGIMAVPVSVSDKLEIEFGEAIRHRADPSAWPKSLDEILGCILVVRRLADGVVISRAWLPLAAIYRRKGKAKSGEVWDEWPIEQAQKTTIKWGFARGYVPLDSVEMQQALAADERGEIIDSTAETLSVEQVPRSAGRRSPLAIEQGPDPVDFREEANRAGQRERVVVNAQSTPADEGDPGPGGNPNSEEW